MKKLLPFIFCFLISWPTNDAVPNDTEDISESAEEKHYGYAYPSGVSRPPPFFMDHPISDNTISSHPIVITSNEQSHIVLDNHKPNKHDKRKRPIPVVSKPVTVKPMKGPTVLGFQIVPGVSSPVDQVHSKPHVVLDYLPGEKPKPNKIIHSNIVVAKKTTTTRRPSTSPWTSTFPSTLSSATFPNFEFVTTPISTQFQNVSTSQHPLPVIIISNTGTTSLVTPAGPIRRPTTTPSTSVDAQSDSALIEITEAPTQGATIVMPLVPSRPLGTFGLTNNGFNGLTMVSRMMRMTVGILLVFLPTALFALGVLTTGQGGLPLLARRSGDFEPGGDGGGGGCDEQCLMQIAANMEHSKKQGMAHFKKQSARFPEPSARGIDSLVDKIFIA